MKGLLKYLSPFAPDQSGATSVLYDLGGITVICDAGGCTGNICGFDEPRWFLRKSAIFSAGLRDMDAILGRDDRLVDKLRDTAQKVDASFAAIIGTPVPAVIATDYQALKRMAEKRCGLPVITVDCTGTRLYDEGAEETYLQLFDKFAKSAEKLDAHKENADNVDAGKKTLGVIGATPLDLSDLHGDELLSAQLKKEGWDQVYTYGMGGDLEEVKLAGTVDQNLVISTAGLAAARFLKKKFGTPYVVGYPILEDSLKESCAQMQGKRVLVVHQQVMANAVRDEILSYGDADVTVATWFMLKPELSQEQDKRILTEAQFKRLAQEGGFDVIIADKLMQRAASGFTGQWIHLPHFAVSGECKE